MKRLYIGAGLLIGFLVLIGAVVLGTNLLRTDEPDMSFSLRRPAAGQVRADYLADGTPVWVVGHEDGSVDVLSGFDTHVPSNLGKVLWWCPSARAFENPEHGSKWDEYGVKLGGPAPAGLASLEVSVRSSRVFLGAPRPAPPLDTPPHGPAEFDREWCRLPQERVFHTFDGWEVWESPNAAIEAAPERWILLEGELVIAPAGDSVLLCALDGCADSVVATNVEVPHARQMDVRFSPLVGRRFIARVRDGALTDVTRIVFLENGGP
ncbi:MAG: hypothetical protein ABIP01_02585 [Candidatus Limnocylindria bacterium]